MMDPSSINMMDLLIFFLPTQCTYKEPIGHPALCFCVMETLKQILFVLCDDITQFLSGSCMHPRDSKFDS